MFLVFNNVARGGAVTDFEQAFYTAAEALVDGESPYPAASTTQPSTPAPPTSIRR